MFKWMLAFCAAFLFSNVASAAMIGDTVTCRGSFLMCSSGTAVVGSGSEFTIGRLLSADFSQGTLHVSNITNQTVNIRSCCTVWFTNQTNPFTGVTVTASSGLTNVDWEGPRFNNGQVSVLLDGLTFAPGGSLTFALTQTQLPAVAEPTTWAMMILGFGMVGAATRRRQWRGTAWHPANR